VVAGETESFHFDTATGEFELVYTVGSPLISAPTIIFAQQALNYPSGMTVTVAPPGVADWKMGAAKNTVEVTLRDSAAAGQKVRVKIQRK
jgi:hypothetical protein